MPLDIDFVSNFLGSDHIGGLLSFYLVLLIFRQQALSGQVYLAVGLDVYYADEYFVS